MTDDRAENTFEPAQSIADIIAQMGVDEKLFLESIDSGLIVLDANVLLALYRIGTDARKQVLEAFRQVSERIWVPHQAIIEFHRNKSNAVVNRISEFRKANTAVKVATANAVSALQNAVDSVVHLRNRTFTSRPWVPANLGLDRETFEAKLEGVLNAAKAELEELESEHDLNPGDIQKSDPILLEINLLIAEKVGEAYSIDRLRSLVEEARDFRFPNRMPPGYEDAKEKSTDLLAAGDYILWRQVIDKAATYNRLSSKVVIITNDVKKDWWTVVGKRRHGARPELVQELGDYAKSQLMLLTLYDFAIAAKERLDSTVSDATVKEIHDVMPQVDGILGGDEDGLNSSELTHQELEELVEELLPLMGYEIEARDYRINRQNFDFAIVSASGENRRRVAVEVKHSNFPIRAEVIRRFNKMLKAADFDYGIIFTSSRFTSEAQKYAENARISLIDGDELIELTGEYL